MIKTKAQPLTTELLELVAHGETEKVRARIRSLSLPEYIGALRGLRKLEDALIEYGEQWDGAYTWGRGMPYPDEDGGETNAPASEKNARVALQAVA